jgi:hypothetical protein
MRNDYFLLCNFFRFTLGIQFVQFHRKFGTSKRFSEGDKKEMSEMIALKLQIARDEWQKETNRLKETLQEERAARQIREEMALTISKLQREFVRRHESQLVTHAHDMITTRELIQRILNDSVSSDILFQFKDNLEKFLRQMASALNQRDALYYEKQKCLKMLGVTNDPKVALDSVISKVTSMTVNANLEAVDKDDIIRKLKKRAEELEKQISINTVNVKDLRRQLAERDREISKLRQMVNIK